MLNSELRFSSIPEGADGARKVSSMTSLVRSGSQRMAVVTLGSAMTLASVGVAPSPVFAADNLKKDFCTESTVDCVTVQVWNVAAAVAKKTNITQKSSDLKHCESIKHTVQENLQGGGGAIKSKFTFRGDSQCKYKVKFVTTSGCIGDKKATVSPDDMVKGKSVWLDRACGTLSTYVSKG